MAAEKVKSIFVNMPVRDLGKARAFFAAVGFEFNEHFTDENATCMVMSETVYAMLLTETYFKSFTKKDIPDTGSHSQVIVALAVENRAKVDELADRALAAGGTITNEPQDHGFMYTRSFQDLDGHMWEIFHMDESAIPQG